MQGISQYFMPGTLPDGFHNEIGCTEVHVCHPHGYQIIGAEVFFTVVILEGMGVPAVYDLIEIILHTQIYYL